MTDTPDILKKILATKQDEVATRKQNVPQDMLQEIAASIEGPRGFYRALKSKAEKRQAAVIAEIKKASPSKGVIRENFKPIESAQD